MGKDFTIEPNGVHVLVDGVWHRCTVTSDAVEVHEKADITPAARYNLMEVRAKSAGMVFEKPKGKRGGASGVQSD